MASPESLPADQRAVLQLLLKQGKSYEELAALLRIDATAVRERAHAAVGALGPAPEQVGRDRVAEIADYLLGQQSASRRAATREYLEASPAGRAWARTTASALAPVAGENLPDIPAEPSEIAQAFHALERRTARRQELERSSRTGGIILLAGIGVALALVLILILSSGDGGNDDDGSARTATQTTAPGTRVLRQATLAAPQGSGSRASGVAFVVRQGGQLGLALQAERLGAARPNSAYAVWLYNRPDDARFLGFIQTARARDGRLESVSALEQGAEGFRELLLTRETREDPQQPGTILLRGRLLPVTGGAQGGAGTAGTTTG